MLLSLPPLRLLLLNLPADHRPEHRVAFAPTPHEWSLVSGNSGIEYEIEWGTEGVDERFGEWVRGTRGR